MSVRSSGREIRVGLVVVVALAAAVLAPPVVVVGLLADRDRADRDRADRVPRALRMAAAAPPLQPDPCTYRRCIEMSLRRPCEVSVRHGSERKGTVSSRMALPGLQARQGLKPFPHRL